MFFTHRLLTTAEQHLTHILVPRPIMDSISKRRKGG
ncbi:unnamed protein product, partial [Brassica oleracea var. botrytis]